MESNFCGVFEIQNGKDPLRSGRFQIQNLVSKKGKVMPATQNLGRKKSFECAGWSPWSLKIHHWNLTDISVQLRTWEQTPFWTDSFDTCICCVKRKRTCCISCKQDCGKKNRDGQGSPRVQRLCSICEPEGTRTRKFSPPVGWQHARTNHETGFSASGSFWS